MALPLTVTIAILLIHCVYFLKDKQSFLVNSIVFFVISIFIMNYLTIIAWNLTWVSISTDHELFISFLLHRNVITPLLLIIFINVFYNLHSWGRKIILLIGNLLIMHVLHYGSLYFNVESFNEWTLLLSSMMDFITLLIGVAVLRLVIFLKDKERSNCEGI